MTLIECYWKEFQEQNPEYAGINQPQSYFYCDNKKDADECAELVVNKIKQATSPAVWWFEKHHESFPRVGYHELGWRSQGHRADDQSRVC